MPATPGDAAPRGLQTRVADIRWYHSIDLGHGIVTPGNPVNRAMVERGCPRSRAAACSTSARGTASTRSSRSGGAPARVVALDHYAWCVDFDARLEYWRACEAAGELPDHRRDLTDFFRPESTPGRRGFDLAKEVLASRVEPVVGDFMETGPDDIGQFDVVLFLGVLYHVREPLSAL